MAQTQKNSLDFEATLKRLDEITANMEKENISLEESLTLYEEGIRLVRVASTRLEEAERRIQMLKMTAEGEMIEVDFPTEPREGRESEI